MSTGHPTPSGAGTLEDGEFWGDMPGKDQGGDRNGSVMGMLRVSWGWKPAVAILSISPSPALTQTIGLTWIYTSQILVSPSGNTAQESM